MLVILPIAFLLAQAAVDAEENAALEGTSPIPATDPGSWVTDADYPSDSIRLGEVGVARFRLGVGRDGQVLDCTILESTGSRLLDEQTCISLRVRARFIPARNAEGDRVESTYTSSINWQIPGETNVPGAPTPTPTETQLEFIVDFAADGTVERCEIVQASAAGEAVHPPREYFCRSYLAEELRIVPYRDANGNAVARRLRFRQEVTIEEAGTPPPVD